MLGGLLLAGVDTDGKPGRRLARAPRRHRRAPRGPHLAKDARREAKLASAQFELIAHRCRAR